METVLDRIRRLVSLHLGVDPECVTETARFIADLGADSLDAIELTMAFEDEFGCEIPEEIADKLLTVGDVRNYVERQANV